MKSTIQKVTNSLEQWLDDESVDIQTNLLQDHFTKADGLLSEFEAFKMETHPVKLVNHNEVLDNDRLPNVILAGLRNYFEFVFLFESYRESQTWYLSEFSIRGAIHKLGLTDQVSAKNLTPPKMSELDVLQISTQKFLEHLNVKSERVDDDDMSYLIYPTLNVSVVVCTKLPAPWAVTQVERTQKLVNQAFSY